jgi:protein SCO1/2
MTDPAAPTTTTESAPTSAANEPSLGARLHQKVAALVGRPLFWASMFAIMGVALIGRSVTREVPKPPELKLALPAFALVDQHGNPFGTDQLEGKIWVAGFIFTSCPSVCPKLTKRMAELQHRSRNLGDAFHLVSFTVDPENDTPEKLLAFSREYRPNYRRWTFATGTLGEIETTVVKGFKIAMGKEEVEHGIFSVFHGERFVLVDKNGDIRGYYDADDAGLDALMRDVGILVNLP